jgi:hypothetical protein
MVAVGLYAWLATASLGMAFLDVVYARLVPGASPVLREVADVLLLVTAATLVSAGVAVALSWNRVVTRGLLLASLVISGLGLVAASVLSPLIEPGAPAGAALRLVMGGLVSGLAMAAFHASRRTG